MNELAQRILELLHTTPGLKATDIASRLGVDRSQANAALYGHLKGRVRQNSSYRWFPLAETGPTQLENDGQKTLDTPLARLCRYYLDCLSLDDLGGVSEFAASKYGDPNYLELEYLPGFDPLPGDPLESDAGRRLLSRARRDRNRLTILLGYPSRLHLIRSRKGWEGYVVEPLLLFQVSDTGGVCGLTLTDDSPQVNFRALRALSETGESSLMEEAILLAEELGLNNLPTDQPELAELIARLREIRSAWDWQEEIDPNALSHGEPLSAIEKEGIFNRAILVAAERSPYTRGLESELGSLQTVPEGKYAETCLGKWLATPQFDSPPAGEQALLEVLPLNSEQRQAVRQALSNPLTVITGPPGTGKSQVVLSLLINATRRNMTVLFASKNNKAVDVVETRVNSLGPRPVLLRLGANEYQGKLAAYLLSLLAATATPSDQEHYDEREAMHASLQERSDALDAELQAFIDRRNALDELEQHLEGLRTEMGEDRFLALRSVDLAALAAASESFLLAVRRAQRERQPLLGRLLWPLIRTERLQALVGAGETFRPSAEDLALPLPDPGAMPGNIDDWARCGELLRARLPQVRLAQQYSADLAALGEARPLEALSRERHKLTGHLSENSEALWEAWLRLQPTRLDPQQRRLLGTYSSLLQLIVSANEQARQLGRDVFRKYYELFPQVVSILPCWAVTSLSARGRLPFEPGFFDMLVIDEASQCDIASALPLLYRARRAVIIGDPMQLRHISALSIHQDRQLLGKHSLVDERPGWAYSTTSLFDLAAGLCRSEDIIALRDHHRSHADIIEFSNQTFYEGRLRVATRHDRLRRPAGDGPAVRWVEVQGRTTRPGTGGALSEAEASAVVSEVKRLLEQGYHGTIGVVSPFRAQANRIRDMIAAVPGLGGRLLDSEFLADTVHRFQGDERDVMIFSPAVSAGISDGALGFLRRNPNLFNVAVTRARAALIVVGDRSAALSCGVDYLSRFAAYSAGTSHQDREAAHPTGDLGPEYPRAAYREAVSDWEVILYKALYARGLRPVPQLPVEKFVLDLALREGEQRLDIEVDGERYHRKWDGEYCRRDQIRNQRLMELGWDIMRFWVYQVRDDLEGCVARVLEWKAAHAG